MERKYNFSAGPSTLPVDVLTKAKEELVSFGDAGMSVMEMSHRSAAFQQIFDETQEKIKKIIGIPEDYHVLFLQGGASTQFAMIPMNLYVTKDADFVNTGAWSKKAIAEAKKVGNVNVVASSEKEIFNYIPDIPSENMNPNADFFYITTNNTIYGTCYQTLPQTGEVPLIADMSSDIMSKKYNVKDFGLIFAGAQKNIGIAGLTVVIIKDDLLSRSANNLSIPTMLNYNTHVKANSMFNTPPCFAIYMTKLVLEWVEAFGGIEALEKFNQNKAAKLYDYIDNSNFYRSTVTDVNSRSIMNIPFISPSKELDALFIEQAAKKGLVNLKGHRSVGGMRASIYNGMPLDGVMTLIEFMQAFEKNNA